MIIREIVRFSLAFDGYEVTGRCQVADAPLSATVFNLSDSIAIRRAHQG